MSCIHTYSNNQIDPCSPEKEQIFIEDIAHALSLICRAGGHFSQFYSVAQHCIACAGEAEKRGYSKKLQLFCLLHDASEAYIADITRPVKAQLHEYLTFEKRLQNMIYEKYLGALPDEDEQKLISAVDDAVLCGEFIHFMNRNIMPEMLKLESQPDYSFRPFSEVEGEYVSVFNRLMKEV